MTPPAPDSPAARPQRANPRLRRCLLWFSLACVALLVAVVWLKPARWFEPTHQGKPVSQWFEEFVAYTNKPIRSRAVNSYYDAFRKMGGDAVPYLIDRLERQPSRFDESYAAFHQKLRSTISDFLPEARDEGYYRARCEAAIRLLSSIGYHQRFNQEAGWPVTPPLASSAQPHLIDLLKDEDSDIRRNAAYALGSFGPTAAEAVPALIQFLHLSSQRDWIMAAHALGEIGPAASNAVQVLVTVSQNTRSDYFTREFALQALGKIGPAAHSATPRLLRVLEEDHPDRTLPLLASVMAQIGDIPAEVLDEDHPDHPDRTLRAAAAAMTRIGFTPDEAVPLLNRMRNSTNISLRMPATLALWNRDPDDPVLTRELKTAFRSDSHSLLDLASDSPHASRFLPEITALLDHPNENTRRNAARAIRKINNEVP